MLIQAFAIASALVGQDAPAARPPVPVYSHAQLAGRMREIRGAEWLTLGRSRSGLEISALRFAAPGARGKPALLIVGNVDGSQPWSSSLALHHAERLAAQPEGERERALLERADVIVIPCANPDAHERRFTSVRSEREATGGGVDDDRDGRQGEDPPSDVDGDGMIAWMRVEDPAGEWIADPADERALIKADAKRGERGRWKLWPEGRDLDLDERVAEDAASDACVNRNFAEEFKEHAAESGAYAMSEPESRALADFVLAHPEIALVVTYGAYDNMVEKPKTTHANARNKLVPAPGVIEADAELLAELGQRYRETTGNTAKGSGNDAGSWQAWLYGHRGLWSLAIHPWDAPLDAKRADAATTDAGPQGAERKPGEEPATSSGAPQGQPKGEAASAKKAKREPSDDAKRLTWIDTHPEEAARFVPWHGFEHPELGPVEIGGFAPFARSEPPASDSATIAEKEFEFLLSLGAELARVRIAELSAKPLAPDLFEVSAAIDNLSRLPLQSASARRTDSVRPLRVRLVLDDGAKLLGGDDALELQRSLGGSGARAEYRWLVRAARVGDIGLSIDTDHAGSDQRRAELKP